MSAAAAAVLTAALLHLTTAQLPTQAQLRGSPCNVLLVDEAGYTVLHPIRGAHDHAAPEKAEALLKRLKSTFGKQKILPVAEAAAGLDPARIAQAVADARKAGFTPQLLAGWNFGPDVPDAEKQWVLLQTCDYKTGRIQAQVPPYSMVDPKVSAAVDVPCPEESLGPDALQGVVTGCMAAGYAQKQLDVLPILAGACANVADCAGTCKSALQTYSVTATHRISSCPDFKAATKKLQKDQLGAAYAAFVHKKFACTVRRVSADSAQKAALGDTCAKLPPAD